MRLDIIPTSEAWDFRGDCCDNNGDWTNQRTRHPTFPSEKWSIVMVGRETREAGLPVGRVGPRGDLSPHAPMPQCPPGGTPRSGGQRPPPWLREARWTALPLPLCRVPHPSTSSFHHLSIREGPTTCPPTVCAYMEKLPSRQLQGPQFSSQHQIPSASRPRPGPAL